MLFTKARELRVAVWWKPTHIRTYDIASIAFLCYSEFWLCRSSHKFGLEKINLMIIHWALPLSTPDLCADKKPSKKLSTWKSICKSFASQIKSVHMSVDCEIKAMIYGLKETRHKAEQISNYSELIMPI